jgi:membrane protein involved in colicin uptake
MSFIQYAYGVLVHSDEPTTFVTEPLPSYSPAIGDLPANPMQAGIDAENARLAVLEEAEKATAEAERLEKARLAAVAQKEADEKLAAQLKAKREAEEKLAAEAKLKKEAEEKFKKEAEEKAKVAAAEEKAKVAATEEKK